MSFKYNTVLWLTSTVSVSFPSLEKVTSSLEIFTAPSTDIVNDRVAVDIDLPALVSVRDLVVEGRIRRFVAILLKY